MAAHRESGQNALGHFRERSDSMTDITELAQRARINAECGEHLSPAETMELVEALESEKRICATWRKTAKSTGEKLEKAQTINAAAEKLVRCKGRYHSEQNYRALAALFGVNTPDLPPLEHENVHYADTAEMEIEALRQRIAELEREQEHLRPVGVMSEKAFHRLENSECRFIALWPRPGIFLPRKRPEDSVIVYARTAAAAGIKVEAE
nr:ead/Ea22-like family protein [Klebsiella pneumoniae]